MSTLSDVQCIGGFHGLCGGYQVFIRGCSVHRRDTMIHVEGIIGGCSVYWGFQH